MSVKSSLEAVCGSLPMERLEQFVEEDNWYDDDDEGNESDSEDKESENDHDPEESILPKEGSWMDLCRNSSGPDESPKTNEDNLMEQSMGLQSIIDHFLSKLEPYNAVYDEDESTDSGRKRRSDTQPLLDEVEKDAGASETPPGTREEQGATVTVQEESCPPEPEEGKIRSKPHVVTSSEHPKHFFIAKEILTSEITYLQGIRLLEKVLHGAVKAARDTGKPMIPESLRKRIFLNISEIHTLNNDFLNELEARIKKWDKNSVVCDILASRAHYFKLYSVYASSFEDSQMAYGESLKKYKPFGDLVQHIENSNLCKGLPVSSYMLYPIQRIPRYKLLLKEYLEQLPENHPDRDHTERALKTISEVAQHLNNRIKDLEEQATVVKMQKLFVGKETLVVPGRKFIMRGAVELVSGRKMSKKKIKVLFLFSDVLLMTNITKKIKFKIGVKFFMTDIQVSSMHSHSVENDFCIFLPSASRPFRFCCRNRQERDLWVKYLRKSVTLETERKKSFEVKVNPVMSLQNINKRSVQTVFQDPSFESHQPKCVRKTFHRNRQMIISPSPSTDSAGIEEVDSGLDFLYEMEEMSVITGTSGDFTALKPGIDNTMSGYFYYKREGSSAGFEEMWFVLTYTGLTGYSSHKTDRPCWAAPLFGCTMTLSQQSAYTFKLQTPDHVTYIFKQDNEYDYTRWTAVLQEIIKSDVNMP